MFTNFALNCAVHSLVVLLGNALGFFRVAFGAEALVVLVVILSVVVVGRPECSCIHVCSITALVAVYYEIGKQGQKATLTSVL